MAKSQKQLNIRRTFRRIDFRERVIIENRYCIDKRRISEIARELNRPTSTIIREIDDKPRIGRGRYSADIMQSRVEVTRKKQGRKSKFNYEPLKKYVAEKLKIGWSPEQISIRLPIECRDDNKMRISYEAVYEYIYSQIYRKGNGQVKPNSEDLRKYLARRHHRRQKKGLRRVQKLEREDILPSIELRPKEVEERKEIGHWEGDTLVSKKGEERIKSINERMSGVAFFKKTINGTSASCNQAIIDRLKVVPSEYLKTLTQDRGFENFNFKTIEKELGLFCFFAHPYCSHERGSNENTNGLFRRYFPKGTDFGKITDDQISKVEYLINSRPRKRFGGLTPYEVFYQITGVALDS